MTTDNTQKSVIEATIEGSMLTLTFSSGRYIAVDASTLSDNIVRHALMHGLKQKLVDAAAIARNPDTGRSATVADKFYAVEEVYTRLLAGSWNKLRVEGGAAGGLLLRALMQHTGKDRDAIVAFLADKTDEQKAALRKNPKVAAIIASLRPEPKTDGIDSDALLADLGD